MITPQDIEAISFDKAVFGGYDMQSVDEVLEPLTQDYLALYKENAVLKSKMRLLVEKLEEYRSVEEKLKAAEAEAQKKCDEMLAAAQQRSEAIEAEAQAKAEDRSRSSDSALNGEKERLNRAKAVTRDFISAVECNIQKQLEALGSLKLMDLEEEQIPVVRHEPVRRAYDYESEKDEQPAAITVPENDAAQKIAEEIEQNVERILGAEPEDVLGSTKVISGIKPERQPDKFDNLQFGPNYSPTK